MGRVVEFLEFDNLDLFRISSFGFRISWLVAPRIGMNVLHNILILATAFVLVFLQATVTPFRHLVGAQVDFLPGLMIYTSLSMGITSISLVAVCGGIWLDSLSANPLGVSVLPL